MILKVDTNTKLGKCASYSRPTGKTCPPDCPFLIGYTRGGRQIAERCRCYAEKIERRYTNVRESWAQNLDVDGDWGDQFTKELIELDYKGVPGMRAHVGGDFMRNGHLDHLYLAVLVCAISRARVRGAFVPIWCYTHAWKELAESGWLNELHAVGVRVYASVHSLDEMREAKAWGYPLAVDPGNPLPKRKHARIGWAEFSLRTCPAQLSEKVHCDKCTYCRRGVDVVFWQH